MIARNHYQPGPDHVQIVQDLLSDGDMHTRWEHTLTHPDCDDFEARLYRGRIRADYAIDETGQCVGLRTGWVIADPAGPPEHHHIPTMTQESLL